MGVTKAEKFMRVRTIRRSILEHRSHAEIVAAGVLQWGVSSRQVERYMEAAREDIIAEVEAKFPDQLPRSIANLDDLYAHLYALKDFRGCLSVLSELNKMLGFYAATHTELTGKNGGPVQVAVATIDFSAWTDEELKQAIALRRKLDAGPDPTA